MSRTICTEPSTSVAVTTTRSRPGLPAPVTISESPTVVGLSERSGVPEGAGDRSQLIAVRATATGFFVRKEWFFYADMLSIGSTSSASVTIDPLLGEIASLPLEDQALLHEVIGRRLVEARRREIAGQAAEAGSALERGDVRRSAATDLLADLETDD